MRRYFPLILVPTKNDLRPVVPIRTPKPGSNSSHTSICPDFGGFSPLRILSVSF